MPKIRVAVLGCALAAACQSGAAAPEERVACPVSASTRGHENIEWSIGYAFNLTDEGRRLPRVLLVGDSICNAYQGRVREALSGKMSVAYWVSSYCVTSPAYLRLLALYLDEADYAVVHFNNGLHSLGTPAADWERGLRAALALIRSKQPKAKIVWTSSTPLKDPAKTAKARELNVVASKVVSEFGGIATDDLFSAMDPLDREANWSDTYHFKPEAVARQAKQVAASCLAAAGDVVTNVGSEPMRKDVPAAPQAVFGVLADVHLVQEPERLAMFERTLRALDARKVDGVVIAGDMVQTGTVPDLMTFGEVWRKVFPGDWRSDGGHVEKLFVYGDHETENMSCAVYTNVWARQPGKMEEMRRLDIYSNDRALQWKRAFDEDYAPIRLKRVKGFDFVLGQFVIRDEPGLRWSEPSFIPGLEEFFATNSFDRTKPFFYVQHKLLRGTVGGAAIGGQDSGRTTAILERHPNAVALCGHKHRTFLDERSLWQGAFTAIEVPALVAPSTPAGHENGLCSCDSADPVPPLQMPALSPWADGHQGLIMSVYADRIVFERREFQFGDAVAEPWVVPWPNDGSMSYARRKARASVPQFAAGASVSVRSLRGKDRKGTPTDQIEVSFPTAHSTSGTPRAFDYEVRAVLTKADVTRIAASKRVFSPKCYLPEAHDTNAVTCVFAKSEIPSNRDSLAFEVRPLNAFGRAGEPIASAPYLADRTTATNPW